MITPQPLRRSRASLRLLVSLEETRGRLGEEERSREWDDNNCGTTEFYRARRTTTI